MNVYKQVCLHGGPTSWSVTSCRSLECSKFIIWASTSTVFNCNSYVAITLQDD